MPQSHEDYIEQAKQLHSKLSRFIHSVPDKSGEDFSEVYDLLDKNRIQDLLNEFSYFVFMKRTGDAEITVTNILDML